MRKNRIRGHGKDEEKFKDKRTWERGGKDKSIDRYTYIVQWSKGEKGDKKYLNGKIADKS